jgi:uncharacterized protein YggU (UPF0235/DUF167 family)
MKILVRAKPGAKGELVKEEAGKLFEENNLRHFTVAVKEPAREGRANRAIERALAEYFGIAPSRVHIVAGHTSRSKVAEIED